MDVATPGQPAGKSPVLSDTRDSERKAVDALDRDNRKEALTILMEAYGRSIYRYCCQMVADEDLAQDVLQETFLQAYESLKRFARRSSLRTWLYRIAHNRCLDALKKDRRREARIKPVEDLSDKPDPATDAEDRVAIGELSRILERCLQELAPRVRTAVLLRYRDGLSYPEMVGVCDERPATLQARVARALPVLRRCIEKLGMKL